MNTTASKSIEIMQRIHHVDPWIKVLGSRPLYWFAQVVVTLVFFSTYGMRLFWAFGLNFFFNSPMVYLGYFSQRIALPLNRLVMGMFYLTFFALYALPFRIFEALRSSGAGWTPAKKEAETFAEKLDDASKRF